MSATSNGKDHAKDESPDILNDQYDKEMWQKIHQISRKGTFAVNKRIEELEKEWSIERFLAIKMSSLGLVGLAAGYKNKKWLALPTVVLGFFMQYAILGWSPKLPFLRKFNLRTGKEIDKEKYILKALRGDFEEFTKISDSNSKSIATLQSALKKS